MFKEIKAFFNYSWSILIARIETLSGLLVGSLGFFDPTALITGVQSGINQAQAFTIGGILLVKGLISEVGRRAGTVTLSDGQLIPAQISEKKEAIEIIQEEKK